MRQRFPSVLLIVALLAPSCGSRVPDEDGLRDAFVEQLIANQFVRNVERSGDEITFVGPAAMGGGNGEWRLRLDSAVVEANGDPSLPFKGTVKSSWYSSGALVQPSGRESNLPVELTSNGLAQDCWALWNDESKRWEWE